MDQEGAFDEKSRGRKSNAGVPLKEEEVRLRGEKTTGENVFFMIFK